jgi:hypothetical protein
MRAASEGRINPDAQKKSSDKDLPRRAPQRDAVTRFCGGEADAGWTGCSWLSYRRVRLLREAAKTLCGGLKRSTAWERVDVGPRAAAVVVAQTRDVTDGLQRLVLEWQRFSDGGAG